MIHALIMAGGAGTRFWPVSREGMPKQFLRLVGQRSMLQETYDRLQGVAERIIVATNVRWTELVREQLPQLPHDAVIGEPVKRDTAPCIGLVAGLILRQDPEAILVVLPADHVIRPVEAFRRAVSQAIAAVARYDRLFVTFGIRPHSPATTYGYIERGAPMELGPDPSLPMYRVCRFREKPSRDVAEQFVAAGTFYWNAGIFVWKARTIWQALHEFEPQIIVHLKAIISAADSADFGTLLEDHFSKIEGKSIDYAVMERYPHVAVIEADFYWDDVGNWHALSRVHGTDERGNCAVGKNLLLDSENTIVWNQGEHLVVLVGLRDVIVAHTPDATLVAHCQAEESLREVVRQLRERGWMDYL